MTFGSVAFWAWLWLAALVAAIGFAVWSAAGEASLSAGFLEWMAGIALAILPILVPCTIGALAAGYAWRRGAMGLGIVILTAIMFLGILAGVPLVDSVSGTPSVDAKAAAVRAFIRRLDFRHPQDQTTDEKTASLRKVARLQSMAIAGEVER